MERAEGASVFAAGGAAYDAFMGRYAVRLAPLMADLVAVEPGQRVLDVGCGSGALTGELVRRVGAEAVLACDPSPALLAACRARHPDVDAREGRAEDLPFDDDSVDAALAQLVFHFVSDPEAGALELRRVVRPGGRVALCVWDVDGGMQMLGAFHEVVNTLDPDAAEDPSRTRLGRAGELSELLGVAGFTDVDERELTVASDYGSFDELWSTLLLGAGPAGAYVSGLSEAERERFRSEYRERLGSPTGSFSLEATAWAAVGSRPR